MATHDPISSSDAGRNPFAPRRSVSVAPHFGADDAYRRFSRAIDLMDGTAIEHLLFEQALFVAQDGTTLEGAAAIVTEFEAIFRKVRLRGMRLRLVFDITDRGGDENIVYDQGTYTLLGRIAATELTLRTGRFLTVFRRTKDSPVYRLDTASIYPVVRTMRSIGRRH